MAFGGLVAVDAVDLSVQSGEVRGVIGPNGSGKTTFLNLVSGIYRPVSGDILLGGHGITRSGPAVRVQKGIARTFQNIRLFPRMTILENVKVARYCRTHAGLAGIFLNTGGTIKEERRVEELAMEALEFVGIADRAGDLPGDLPYGQQRLVEIARALATEPRLLLLDEPAAGMSLEEKRRFARLVRAIQPGPRHRDHRNRTRYADHQRALPPGHGAEFRQGDSRGHAGRGAEQRVGDRSISGKEPAPCWS